MSRAVPIPVIASGGAGTLEHFVEVFTDGRADAALAASIFHFSEHGVADLKQHLHTRNSGAAEIGWQPSALRLPEAPSQPAAYSP